jgi:hypothetical protein
MDTNPDKLEAALEQLEAERDRRQQAQIDSGEAVLWSGPPIVVGCGDDEDAEEALANLPTTAADGRPIYYDGKAITVVVTGVPRSEPAALEETDHSATAPDEGVVTSPLSSEPAERSVVNCTRPTYVRVVVSNGNDDGDPGAIAEAWFTIEEGFVVLRDSGDKHITSRALLKGDDPAVLARSLLREVEQPKDFNRPIHYPKIGYA